MKNERITVVSLAEILYYISFSLLLLAKGLGYYDGQAFFKVCLVLSVLAWAGKMWLTKYTKKEIGIILLLICLCGYVYLVSGEKGALIYFFMITGLKNVPIKRVFSVGAIIWTVFFAGNAWINALHLVDGPFKVHEKLGMGMLIRWGLGQSHPNVLHISFLVLVMFIVYLLKDKFDLKTAAIIMLGNVIVFLYSLSSTGVIVVTFYLALNLYWKYRKKLSKIEQVLIQLVLPVCLIYSLVAPLALQGRAFEIINDFTNTRLTLARRFLTETGASLFGVKLSEIITSQLTMDNSYVFAFVTYGVILFVFIVIAYCLLVFKYCREQKGNELCIILACFLAGIMEPFLFNTSYKNISLLFMKDILFEEEKEATICFPGYFYKEFSISWGKQYIGLKNKIDKIKNRKNAFIIAAIVGIVIGSLGYQIVAKPPKRILVPEPACDVAVIQRTEDTLAAVYLESEEGPEETDQVLGYIDEKTRMIIYSDGIVQIEHIRGMVCSGLTTGFLVAIGTAFLTEKTYKRKSMQGR